MNDYYKTIKKVAKMIMKERSKMEDYEKYDFEKERLVTYKKGYLSTKIDLLPLSAYIRERLKNDGCTGVGDILHFSKQDLLRLKGIGEKSAEEIYEVLTDLKKYIIDDFLLISRGCYLIKLR